MDTWQEFSISIHRDAQEALANLLIELGSQGVAISDSKDITDHKDSFGEILPEVEASDIITVTAYFPDTLDLSTIQDKITQELTHFADYGLTTGQATIHQETLAEEDWAENWKQYFTPSRVTHDLTIVPSWTDYEGSAEEKCIRLDPGMAFGTGTHPTTKMSLYALEQVLRGGETVLDVGTGSGVLAIASHLLGAKAIYAYDLDEVAVRVAKENIALNPGTQTIHVAAGDLLKGVTQTANVIVANILADILVQVTDDAYRLLNDEGYLIMSGIIAEKWNMVKQSAEEAGFFLETHMIQGEWHTCIFKKTDNRSGVIGG